MAQNDTNTLTPDAMIAQLRAMRQQIPDYTQLTTKQSRGLVTVSRVSPEMVNAAANAVDESPAVQSSVGMTTEEIRQMSADGAVWSALEAELAATHRGVAMANLQRRHRLGTAALVAYAVSQTLVRKPEHAGLLPRVAEMRRLIRIGRGRTAPVPVPHPDPQPHADAPATTQ